MPPSFWVASTKPEAALARGQGWQPWQEGGWTLAPRDRGPEAGMYCWMGHYGKIVTFWWIAANFVWPSYSVAERER